MTAMDVENTIERISGLVEALAQGQQRISGWLERVAQAQMELAERQSRGEETIGHLVTAVGQLATSVGQLREHAEHTDKRMDQGFRELREAQQQTEQNLNALIRIVDDLIRRDGGRR